MSTPYLIICNTPRSGSTLAASMLLDTGACTGGHEYFESENTLANHLLPQLGLASVDAAKADIDAYVDRIKRIWGVADKPLCVKIQWYQLMVWRPHGLDLQKHFPGARFISCTRTNLPAQVVSLVRALQTGGWTAKDVTRESSPKYGFWRLMYEMSRLVNEEESWEGYFREHGIEPYRLRYEDLDSDYRGTAVKLLDWLGFKLGPIKKLRLRPPIAKQRDQLNRDWEHRFYRDLIHWHSQWEQLPLEQRRQIWGREPG